MPGLIEQIDALLNPGRLRFNNGLLRDAYLAKAAEAVKKLGPEEAAKLGIVDDSVGSNQWINGIKKLPKSTPEVPRVPDLMMDYGYPPVNMNELLKRAYRMKPWMVDG